MNVTLLTDASYCHDLQVGGFGYWVVSERGKAGGGGALRGTVPSNNCAEMMAVVKGLYAGIRIGVIMAEDEVLVQVDNLLAIDILSRPPGVNHFEDREAIYAEVYTTYRSIVDKHQLTVRFRHVKAHTKRPEPRYVANHMCDARARRGMEDARAEARRRAKFNTGGLLKCELTTMP